MRYYNITTGLYSKKNEWDDDIIDFQSLQKKKITQEVAARFIAEGNEQANQVFKKTLDPEAEFWPGRDVNIPQEFPNIESSRRIQSAQKKPDLIKESLADFGENNINIDTLSYIQNKKLRKEDTLPEWATRYTAVKEFDIGNPVSTPSITDSFFSLGISRELEDAIRSAWPKISKPTQIQSMTIPEILKGKNTICTDQTGSGKTLTYILPIMQNLLNKESEVGYKRRGQRSRALIILPNRELILQTDKIIHTIMEHDKRFGHWKTYTMSGGIESVKKDVRSINDGVDILLATPERILHHLDEKHFYLDDISHVVFDEADTLMSEDKSSAQTSHFVKELKDHMSKRKKLDKNIVYIFVSATVSKPFMEYLKCEFPKVSASVGSSVHKSVSTVNQEFLFGAQGDFKRRLLFISLKKHSGKKTIIFCNRQETAKGVHSILKEKGYDSLLMTASVPPKIRMKHFDLFNETEGQILVTTDLASRGLDITNPVEHVILYDFPNNTIDYIHRIGRTARAGLSGKVTALIAKKDHALATKIRTALIEGLSVADIAPSKPKDLKSFMKAKIRSKGHRNTRRVE